MASREDTTNFKELMERREAGYDRQSPRKKDAGVRDLGLGPSIEAAVRRRGHGRRRKRGTKGFASRPRNWRGRCLVPQLADQREAAIYQGKELGLMPLD